MTNQSAPHNRLNVRLDGDVLRAQLQLESALATGVRESTRIRNAIAAGADPRLYPIAELKERWVVAPAFPHTYHGQVITPDRTTLLGHLLMITSSSNDRIDKTVKNMLSPVEQGGSAKTQALWKEIPPAFTDHRGEEVSIFQVIFHYDHCRSVAHRNKPLSGTVSSLLERLDTQSRHIRCELADAAKASLARCLDSPLHVQRASQDDRPFDYYNVFGKLVLAGASLNEDDLGKTIRCKVGASECRLPMLSAASLPIPENILGESLRDWKQADLLRQIIALGGNVNARGANRRTPLMLAAEHGQVESVAILLEHGAQTQDRDVRNWTAHSYAKRCKTEGGLHVLAMLQAHEARQRIANVMRSHAGVQP